MKKQWSTLGLLVLCLGFNALFAQNFWRAKSPNVVSKKRVTAELTPQAFKVYELQVAAFKRALRDAPLRGSLIPGTEVLIDFPLADGSFETYKVIEAPVLDATLSAQYPDIKSYAGQGLSDPSDIIRFSVTPLGVKSMLLSTKRGYEFIEPYSEDLRHYMVYQRKDRHRPDDHFECGVKNEMNRQSDSGRAGFNNADDGILRTYRLAVSTTGEYTAYHGGTVAGALAAINTTMTRVNGIYEVDFNITMVLISSTTSVIYTNASTDPYSSGGFNGQLQSTLTSVIGEPNYDIGHLFARASNNGNAGCIGCVCTNGSKGSAFTSGTIPEGDLFDVDYVCHEMGHQFGANHTWTFGGNEGTNVQMEPGSGTTIMGYAGITGPTTDVQPNSDPYFHAVSIEQITDYIKSRTCQTNTPTGNTVPTVNAGPNYTIPRGTPFVLDGTASDPDGDPLTYCWEQMNENNATTTLPSVSATSGVAFRSFSPTTSTQRSFPALATVLSGSTATTWEAVPNVGRTLNFRLTVRDNRAGGGTNESDNTVITVNGSAGPFVVTSPNTAVTLSPGPQTITWDVAGTNATPINTSSVNILLSTDGGNNFSTTLAANTPNDGSQSVTIPSTPGTTNRIKIEAVNNVFYDISNSNFTIGTSTSPSYCASNGNNTSDEYISNVTLGSINNTTGPGTGGYSDFTSLSTDLIKGTANTISISPTWTSTVYNEGYAVWIDYNQDGDFLDAGEQVFTQSPTNSTPVSGTFTVPATATDGPTRLRVRMQYNTVPPSSCGSFTYGEVEDYTVNIVGTPSYCASNGNNTSDEYISNVTLGSINNPTGPGAGGYSDFTSLSTDLVKGTANTITIVPTWPGTIYNEGYTVWIDYNQDGDFSDADERVFALSPAPITPVNGTFTVPATATDGPTRMRVTMRYNTIPVPCGSFTYGEVEDYTVNIVTGSGGAGCAGGLSLPYTESFEVGLGDWAQSTADDFNWTRHSGGTLSSNTGPSAAAAGTFYVYTESSTPNYPSQVAILDSPCFDLTGLSSATFNFQYHLYGASNMGNLLLEASDDDGGSWTLIWSRTGNQGNAWQSASVNLSAYIGSGLLLRYVGTTGTPWRVDMAIDDLSISTTAPLRATTEVSVARVPSTPEHRPEFVGNLQLFPNPATTRLTVQFQSLANVQGKAVLRDVLGSVVAVQNWDIITGANNFEWDVAHLSEGTYFLEWSDDREVAVARFVITR